MEVFKNIKIESSTLDTSAGLVDAHIMGSNSCGINPKMFPQRVQHAFTSSPSTFQKLMDREKLLHAQHHPPPTSLTHESFRSLKRVSLFILLARLTSPTLALSASRRRTFSLFENNFLSR
jgi:hypothetical protein